VRGVAWRCEGACSTLSGQGGASIDEEADQVLNWYLAVLKKYTVFNGRAGRPEFWWFTLASLIVSIVLEIIGAIINGASGGRALTGLYSLAVLLPSLGVGIRRLHDTDRSGWWLLIALIPVVGWIILIVFYASRGTAGANRYGAEAAPAPAAA
jgi:uncharacterized membrane protein YhaH (DUF805 family)